jgi:hypothetical protein
MTSSTILLWRDPRDGDLFGATGLLKWRSYHRRPGDEFFTPLGDPGALGGLARAALGDALRPAVDIEAASVSAACGDRARRYDRGSARPRRAEKGDADDIYASVADDPGVIAAGRRWDRASASTHWDLVAAVLAGQERAGARKRRKRFCSDR